MFNMAEVGMFTDVRDELIEKDDDVEKDEFLNISEADSENIHQQLETLPQYTGDVRVSQRERLKRDKVKAWLNEIEFIT